MKREQCVRKEGMGVSRQASKSAGREKENHEKNDVGN